MTLKINGTSIGNGTLADRASSSSMQMTLILPSLIASSHALLDVL
jgi:hypothetical protein